MKLDKFMEQVGKLLTDINSEENKSAFSDNMKHIGLQDETFPEWLSIFLAWNEMGSEEDIKNFFHVEGENVQE